MYFGSFFGIRLKFNYLFLLLLVSIAASGWLPEATIVFMVLLAHEFGHVMVARRLGLYVKEIEITPFGGVAQLQDIFGVDPEIEAKVALAGPAVNLIFIGLMLTLNSFFNLPQPFVRLFLQTNMLLVLFNLLPALPLDGGRVFRAFMARKIGFQNATIKAARGGLILSAILILTGVVGVFFGFVNFNVFILAIFLFVVVRKERQHAVYTFMQYLGTKQSELMKEKAMPVTTVAVSVNARIKDLFSYFIPKRYHVFMVIGANGKSIATLTETQILQVMMKQGIDVIIRDIL